MERTKKRKFSFIVAFSFFAVSILLANSFITVYASLASSNAILPDFLIRYAQYLSEGNTTKLKQIINQMITQKQIRDNRIASTNGAVLQFSPSSSRITSATESLMYTGYSWMSAIYGYSEPMYDEVTGYMVSEIQYPTYMTGQPDTNYALLWTNGWNENYYNPMGGEAMAWGPVWDGASGWASGDVYIHAYTDIPYWQNYVIIQYSDGFNWYVLWYAAVTSTSPTWIYIGSTGSEFSLISVICWTPPPYPIYYEPLVKNYVWVDSVAILG